MAKAIAEIRSLARAHTETALNTLVGVMEQPDAPPAARVAAANSLLDRGWGKPAQPIENGEDGAFKVIQRIERIIADPANSNGEGV